MWIFLSTVEVIDFLVFFFFFRSGNIVLGKKMLTLNERFNVAKKKFCFPLVQYFALYRADELYNQNKDLQAFNHF